MPSLENWEWGFQYLSFCLFICLSVHPPTHLSIHMSLCLCPENLQCSWLVHFPLQDFRNVSMVNYTLLFTASASPPPDPSLCSSSDSQVTTGSIPFQGAVLVQDTVSGKDYLQLIPAFCWSQGSVSVPYRLALNTVLQPPGNVSMGVWEPADGV